jgi:hypothetical protein
MARSAKISSAEDEDGELLVDADIHGDSAELRKFVVRVAATPE